jgi:hypothetical protein
MRTKRNRRFTGVRNMNHKPEMDDSVRKKKHSTISTSHASVSEDTNVFNSFCLIEHLSPITYIICLNRNTAFPGN